jgi:Ca2+/Na+ antiporter
MKIKFKGHIMLEFLFWLIILVSVLQVTYSFERYILSFILILSLSFVSVKYTLKKCQMLNYEYFRDNSYRDYSKDREYLKWLIDNPKESVDDNRTNK